MTQTVVVLTSGSSWSRPSDCPDVLDLVECWGGGGAGTHGIGHAGGGGSAGAYASKSNYSIGAQTSVPMQIPGVTAEGTAPIDTWFDSATTGVKAKSGNIPTTGSINGAAANNSSASVGDIIYPGGAGGKEASFKGGGGGGSGTSQSAGSAASTFTGGDAGTGGGLHGAPPSDHVEGGGGADGRAGSGYNGASPGGAGSGGNSAAAGSGGRGQIRITYTPIPSNVVSMMCEA